MKKVCFLLVTVIAMFLCVSCGNGGKESNSAVTPTIDETATEAAVPASTSDTGDKDSSESNRGYTISESEQLNTEVTTESVV